MTRPRVEWSPDSTRFLARLGDHRIRLHAADGELLRGMGTALDVKWDGDLVVSFDDRGTLRWHGPNGVVDQRRLGWAWNATAACFARDLERLVIQDNPRGVVVTTFEAVAWQLDRERHALQKATVTSAVLAARGTHLAIGYETAAPPGRGFVVIELARDTTIARGFLALEALALGATSFAFDRAGARCAMIDPEPGPGHRVLALGRGEDHSRTQPGGATAVALDPLGMIAAYAYATPPPGARGRLRFDYLEPEPSSATVEVHGTLELEVALPDVVALGFDPTSRWLACLASTGELEIVLVP